MSAGIPVAEARAMNTQHYDISSPSGTIQEEPRAQDEDFDYMDESVGYTAPQAPYSQALELARQSQQETHILIERGLETHRAIQEARDRSFSVQISGLGQQLRDALIQGHNPLIRQLIDQANAQAVAQQQLQLSHMSDLDRMRRQQVRQLEPALEQALEDRPRAKAKSMPNVYIDPLPLPPLPASPATEIVEFTGVPSAISTMPSTPASTMLEEIRPQTPKKTKFSETPEDTHERAKNKEDRQITKKAGLHLQRRQHHKQHTKNEWKRQSKNLFTY